MRSLFIVIVLFCLATGTRAQSLDSLIEKESASLVATYKELHAAPELSYREEKTAAMLARELRTLGYEVTERVGKYDRPELTCYGVVAVMKNGAGPTIMVRADLDGLPVEEKTGLSYASRVKVKDENGSEVNVMHACGHDIHVTCLIGVARMLVQTKDRWQGTVVLIGQPAEERGAGAKAMLNDGLYTRFPKPDYVLALHDAGSIEAGKIGYCEGFAYANVDTVDVTIRGVGGHGASPNFAKDPIVVASQVVLALQTIVSRENSPLEPAVVTVGSFHGGTKHNIIPEEVKLQLTVRSYKEEVRRQILASIERIARGIALAAGIPADLAPIVKVNETEFTPATYNDPELTRRLVKVWQNTFGTQNVERREPVMGGEDFGRYSLPGQQIPICMFSLGAVEPEKVKASLKEGKALPSAHSSYFAPIPEPTITTGVKAMMVAIMELMGKAKAH